MQMPAKITVVGSLNIDLVGRAPRLPKPGETIIGGELATIPGGKGGNQAVAAALLGAQVSLVGHLGGDAFAHRLLESLEGHGVSVEHLSQDTRTASGAALITVGDSGENSIVVLPGANRTLLPEHIDAARESIIAADVLLLQLEIPLETVRRAVQVARGAGVKVLLNPAPARRPLPPDLLLDIDVLAPNESEAELLTGLPVDDDRSAGHAAQKILELGVGAALITLGSHGALLAARRVTQIFPAYPVNVVDTTAAGDAFLGGFAVALAEGKSLAEAAAWGNAAGALACTKLGAQSSLPTRSQVEALLDEFQ